MRDSTEATIAAPPMSRVAWFAGMLAILCACLCAWAASASAADQHLFDAQLSLTGSCASNSATPPDTIPDPGCPYPESYKPKPFKEPCGTATDSHGYIYVASAQASEQNWINVFDAAGKFVTSIDTGKEGLINACRLDVDSTGRVYVRTSNGMVYRFTPKAYPPPKEAGAYGAKELFSATGGATSVAVDPSDDHVYVATGPVVEYTPEGVLVDSIPVGAEAADDVDVWGKNHDFYLVEEAKDEIRIYDGTTHALKETIEIESELGGLKGGGSIAVDQANGDLYVHVCPAINCFVRQYGVRSESGEFELVGESGAEQELQDINNGVSDLALDSPFPGEAGYDSPNEGYLFVSSGSTHLYAFAPLEIGPPVVSAQDVIQVTTSSATLRGKVAPNGAPAEYRFEYVDEAGFQENGWAGASTVGGGEIANPNAPATSVSVPLAGLEPGSAYRFRVVATNHCNPLEPETDCTTEGPDTTFATYPQPEAQVCPNAALRTGPSAELPDCRAYELVTPPSSIVPVWNAGYFDVPLTTPSGGSLLFASHAGALPGTGGNGLFDAYRALRGPEGWQFQVISPSGAQTGYTTPVGISPNHEYSIWIAREPWGGSLEIPGVLEPQYLRDLEGSFELVGRGSEGEDPMARAWWISDGTAHLIFATGAVTGATPVQLEPEAAPSGTAAIYDRSADGATHVVSIKPGEESFGVGEHAEFLGASADGTAVAFRVKTTTYVRLDNAETLEVGEGVEFAGLSESGDRLFYLQGGDIFALDTGTGEAAPIGSGGESTVVNVSADGSRVYFSSPKQLEGEAGQAGEPNLYVWDGATTSFIATLDPADFTGEINLGFWIGRDGSSNLGPDAHNGSAIDPSRSTPDGSALLFESHADLSPPYEGKGHSQVYRYNAVADELACVSCNPTGSPATSDARLQGVHDVDLVSPLFSTVAVANLTENGERAFFESEERLVSRDTDGLFDVYEWRADGTGGCKREGGCLALISAGPGATDDYLWAVTPDGSDVFIRTSDTLLDADTDGDVPSIYDARVNGGFQPPPPPPADCLGEACQPAVVVPDDPTPASSGFSGAGSPQKKKVSKRCDKGQRKVRRKGKARCVRKQRKQNHSRRAAR